MPSIFLKKIESSLESFKTEVDSFENDRLRLDQKVEEIQLQIKTSRDELDKWFKSDEANKLFAWPTK